MKRKFNHKQGYKNFSGLFTGEMLELPYQSIHDATQVLGKPNEIRQLFVDFQQYLYP